MSITLLLIAALANTIISFLWYQPVLFGTHWMKEMNLSPEQVEQGRAHMHRNTILALCAGTLTALALRFFEISLGIYSFSGAIKLALLLWLGFCAVPMLGIVLWEQKSFSYYVIVAGNWLVSFVVMAVILVA